MVEEAIGEAHVSAQHPASSQEARLPGQNTDPRRPGDPAESPTQGSSPSLGLIWRIRDRATFEQLRRHGRRARRGEVSVTFVADDGGHPRVAYGVGRKVGPAVVRNRVRRRLRAAVREVDREQGGLPPGAYLMTVRPGAARLDYAELRRAAAEACLEASRPASRRKPQRPEGPA